MAIKIDDEVMKEYTERNNLPEVYEAYKGIKNAKDLKRAMKDKMFRRTVEGIEAEQKISMKIDALNKLREDATLEDATDEELVEYMPETFADINAEKAEVQYGVPANLFPPKEGMSNREWLAVTRENFKRAGLDFDDKEDRQRAAEAAARAEQKEFAKAEAAKEGLSSITTPRSSEKMAQGEPVTIGDAASDLLRIAEAAPPMVAYPAIAIRNGLDAYLDYEEGDDIGETFAKGAGKTFSDMLDYQIGGKVGESVGNGLKGVFRMIKGTPKGGIKAINGATRDMAAGSVGTRPQVAKATQAALEGKTVGPWNPYGKEAAQKVAEADLTQAQKKKAIGALSKYLKESDPDAIAKQAETATTTKKIGKTFDKEVDAESKRLGKELVTATADKKLNFDDIAQNLNDTDAANLLDELVEKGLRDAEGAKSYAAVGAAKSRTPEAFRETMESEVIEKWLKGHAGARNSAARSQAEKNVTARYGTQPDVQTRGLMKYVLEAPVAYEKGTRGKFIGEKTKQGLGRYLGVEGLPRAFRYLYGKINEEEN
jgi:hypothetical protein